MKKKFLFVIFILLLIGILVGEYFYLKNHQEIVYVNVPQEMTSSVVEVESTTKTKVKLDEKEQLNTDYHIRNDASKNMQLENTIDRIINQTTGEKP